MSKKKRSIINIETIIVLLIAACMLFLNVFTSNKLVELEQAGSEALFIRQDLPYSDDEELAEEILQYHPDSCKMIEMYSENFELLFSIQFKDENIPKNDINNYPELIELLKSSQEGETTISVNGYEEAVYFQWVTNTRGELRLIIIYSIKPVVSNIWVFHLVTYLVLILVFALLIRLHNKHYDDKIREYRDTARHIRNEVNEQI